jgi:hypothetical protein
MKRWLVVLSMSVVLAPWAYAQGTANSVELTPTAGYWLGDTISRGMINGVNNDVTIDDTPSYGLRIAYKITPSLALEGFFTREKADLVTGHGDLFSGKNKVGTMDMTAAEANLEFAFGHSRLVPFIVGGFGAMRLEPTLFPTGGGASPHLSAETRFMGDFGGGLKLFFSPNVALRFDWRGHSVNIDSGQHCDWYDSCSYDHNWLTFTELGLGLTFAF